jgi:cystathionine gamma-synthase
VSIAEHFAASHPRVLEVLYPGLPGFAGHAVAKAQMNGGYGGRLSIRMRGGAARSAAAVGGARKRRRRIADLEAALAA